MATALTVHVNISAVDSDRVTAPANFVQMDLVNDKLIWSAGSAVVADGLTTPNSASLDEAATIIQTIDVEVAKLFLLDFSDTGQELKEVGLAGSIDTQFVVNFSFDGPTASEPTLEAYDDITHTSISLNVLGASTPANSMIKAVLTTAGLPGASWTGTAIAGSLSPNILDLNAGGGALTTATDVYVNLKVVIPGVFGTPFSEAPVLTVRYTFV